MRDFNDDNKQRKITASQIMLSKRLTGFMTEIMFPYIYIWLLISSLDLIKQCQCSQSATNIPTTTSERPNSDAQVQSRKLQDNVEAITTFGNLISDPIPMIIGSQKEYQYYDDSLDSLIQTEKYDSPPSIDLPTNHQPIHKLDVNQQYFPDVETVSFVPSDPYHPNLPNLQNLPNVPNDPFVVAPPTPTFVRVTREPIWAKDVLNLENQYISTFRSIKTSVMSFYSKMQDFLNYFMSFFSLGRQISYSDQKHH